MTTSYLFRFDGAKENDGFFAAVRSLVSLVYAGTQFRVGAHGWIPDLVRVLEEPPDRYLLTLIELEDNEPNARASCRRYLPENPGRIIDDFKAYLERVLVECRGRADNREFELSHLRESLSRAGNVSVSTAGQLRAARDFNFLEEWPVTPEFHVAHSVNQSGAQSRVFAGRVSLARSELQGLTFHGEEHLSQREVQALVRCIKILDAVMRNHVFGAGVFRTWRSYRTQPLVQLLKNNEKLCPELRRLIFEIRNTGTAVEWDKLLRELADIWSEHQGKGLGVEEVRNLVASYFPNAKAIRPSDSMQEIFSNAREHILAADQGLPRPPE